MKRNLPPPPAECKEEQLQIQARIEQLFEHSNELIRKVPISNKGYWCDSQKHVKIHSLKGLPSEFVSFSPEFKHHYLGPFEALYCLESSQLLIFYNGLPLSLAEAYQLLLTDPVKSRNYRLFQQLNRSGFICLGPSPLDQWQQSDSNLGVESCSPIKIVSRLSPRVDSLQQLFSQGGDINFVDKVVPLFQIDQVELPFGGVMSRLQELGPSDCKLTAVPQLAPTTSTQSVTAQAGGDGGINDLNITFDLYKRETFAKNRPRKGKQGNMDYYLIACDKAIHRPPNFRQLAQVSNKLLFGLVDHDNSVCFAQWL